MLAQVKPAQTHNKIFNDKTSHVLLLFVTGLTQMDTGEYDDGENDECRGAILMKRKGG
jgi:hypothetical protein